MSSTASAVVSSTAASATSPPIAQLIPLVRNISTIVSSIALTLSAFLFLLLRPLHIFTPILFSVLTPFTLVFHILVDGLLLTPYAIVSGAISALYPVYVFCGVACVSGAMVGMFGRGLVAVLNGLIIPATAQKTVVDENAAVSKESPAINTPGRRRRRTFTVRKSR
ncbi:hypothetical protein BJ138DRAFT_1058607 [Hygrophoropsis aurantiaca]|uniref:Uncharacterized protein n=1 Tax=Hygrophoropsis aurantiaca TaxID=72124 RepID=A0ACB8AL08_9AGAM|nr:hypothetical protein BJ138DRAFT_1058607 [Hygrophoropsis aurantiaca]